MIVTVHDVAAYILQQYGGAMTSMKLEKLVYYSQAWSLVWDEEPLFGETIEAWVNGPVVPELYARHRGIFKVSEWDGNPERLSTEQRNTVNAVIDFYGKRSSMELSQMTHREDPWIIARKGLSPSERGSREISLASMAEYYGGLLNDAK
jgi:uncharacterized phage-associated protein